MLEPNKQIKATMSNSSQNQRSPSPLVDKPVFNHRRRSPSPKSMVSGRSNSENVLDNDLSAKMKKIVQKAMRARLYLLHQGGPLTFLIGGDSPEHKYRVTIGKQSCSCGKGPHCIHVLFVMLRVFQLKETDPLLWAKELKNYEVESLFRTYHKRLANLAKGKRQPITDGSKKSSQQTEVASTSQSSTSGSNSLPKEKDDDETCPICLLEMVEGESMTICTEGCLNKLHHHCMSIWAQECKRRHEPMLCPLCRTEWKSARKRAAMPVKTSLNSPRMATVLGGSQQRESVSPTLNIVQEDVGLPKGEVIPDDSRELTQSWVQIFGNDMVACLLSRDWKNRETGLKYMSRKVTKVLNERRTTTSYQETRWSVLDVCCSVLKHMSSDPVYNVYVGALRTFRAMLSCVNVRRHDDVATFYEMVQPVIEKIILKCADSNRRVTVVSLKILQEFVKWDSQPRDNQAACKVQSSGFDFIVELLEKYENRGDSSWQWRLGFLVFLKRVFDENLEFVIGIPEEDLDELSIQPVSLDSDFDMSNFLETLEQNIDHVSGEKLFDEESLSKLRAILRFCATSSNCKHKNVWKMALSLLIRTTQIVAKDRETFNSLKVLLKSLKPNIQHILQRQLSSDRLRTPTSMSPPAEDYAPDDMIINEAIDLGAAGTSTPVRSGSPLKCDRRSGTGFLTPPPTPPKSESATASPLDNTDSPRSRLSQLREMYVPKCEELVAQEEAEALAMAINMSLTKMQSVVPDQLSQGKDDDIIIRVQPESEKDEHDGKHVYLENSQWRKGGLLGTGAYSSCFEVSDIKTGRLMAVKQVSFYRNSLTEQEKVKKAVLDEINLMYRLHHPHIVNCLGATQHLGHFNIFMEIMPGGSLSRLLSRFGAFQNTVILKYTRQILMALAYLHDYGCLHRDIKGANILADSTGQVVKLSDFGTSSKLLAQGTGSHEFCGQLLGTIAFMAPEVIRGESYGRKCDIWSLGCVIIEMATCHPPWNAEAVSNHLALMYKIASATNPPPIPDQLEPGMRDVALRCLEPKEADRPAALDLLKHAVFRV
ncbi:mitogen-activated protein kinase kinase kinase 1-like isoform X2 [Rhopilema esculentum]|uniref:mitogen-activated protein kinase kinase kinase 1-like isoform X2 n=1 Tax=Rhopilema esculentum TaxID=499914 RepID=UPI0031E3E537